MATEQVVETPVADPIDAEIPGDESSIADHAAVFGAGNPALEGEDKERLDKVRERVRHRARSQEASPEDVPRIRKLSTDLRDRDEQLAARDKRIAELEARLTPSRPPTSSVTEPRSPGPAAPPRVAGDDPSRTATPEPTRPKPSEDEVGTKYKTYADFVDDFSDWKDEQREAKRTLADQARQSQDNQALVQQAFYKGHEAYAAKLVEFRKTHPDYDALAKQHEHTQMPPVAHAALLFHDNGPALVYYLFQHPDVLAEVHFVLDGKPLTHENVAHATRWLTSRTQAATTGSAAPTPPVTLGPRPPNPVRTGPMKTTDDAPDDDSSIADHEKWLKQRRR